MEWKREVQSTDVMDSKSAKDLLATHRRRLAAAIAKDDVNLVRRALQVLRRRARCAGRVQRTAMKKTHCRFLVEGALLASANTKQRTYEDLKEELFRSGTRFGVSKSECAELVACADSMNDFARVPNESTMIGVTKRINDVFRESLRLSALRVRPVWGRRVLTG